MIGISFFIEQWTKKILLSNKNFWYYYRSRLHRISWNEEEEGRNTERSTRIIRVSLNRCRFAEESDKSKWICLPQTIRFLLVSTRAAKSAVDFYGPVFMNRIGGPQSRTRIHNARSRPRLGLKTRFSARTAALSNDSNDIRTSRPRRIPLELRGELKLSPTRRLLQFEGRYNINLVLKTFGQAYSEFLSFFKYILPYLFKRFLVETTNLLPWIFKVLQIFAK